jgi:hypothetical protein
MRRCSWSASPERGKDARPAPDLLNRNFKGEVADITFIPTSAASCI